MSCPGEGAELPEGVSLETALEQAERRLVKAKARLALQEALVAEMIQKGQDTTKAQAARSRLRQALLLLYDELARQQGRAARSRASNRP